MQTALQVKEVGIKLCLLGLLKCPPLPRHTGMHTLITDTRASLPHTFQEAIPTNVQQPLGTPSGLRSQTLTVTATKSHAWVC